MRVTLVIDHLGCGGAQRQLTILATMLRARGFSTTVLTYQPHDFFRNSLEAANIDLVTIGDSGKLSRIWKMRRAIRATQPDVVIAYLITPSMLAELSSVPHRNFQLIVSERSCDMHRRHPKTKLRFLLHRLADAIVTNSYAQKRFIESVSPALGPRTEVIHNCVQLDKYRPAPGKDCQAGETIRVAILGNFYEEKNPLTFLRGFHDAVTRTNIKMEVDWYGNNFYRDGKPSIFSVSYVKLQELISQFGLEESFRTHPPVADVLPVYAQATVFCLPSIVEAFPNVIGEAMACGLPILASRVGDNDILVEDGVNGLLFDPRSTAAISDALVEFAHLSTDQRHEMERRSRERAESLLSPARFVDQYVNLLRRLSGDGAEAA